jgi:Domain of unknown function (DUF1918)
MDAKIGDEIVVDGVHTGDEPREGEILEVLTAGDVVHYLVRWDDGHESIFYPSSTAHTVRVGKR